MPEPAAPTAQQAGTARVLRALADPLRLQIMDRLAERPRGVTELARSLPITRQGTAKHLAVLRGAGLVVGGPGPTGESYRVIAAPVDEASRTLARAADRWTTQLELLKRAAESSAGGSGGTGTDGDRSVGPDRPERPIDQPVRNSPDGPMV